MFGLVPGDSAPWFSVKGLLTDIGSVYQFPGMPQYKIWDVIQFPVSCAEQRKHSLSPRVKGEPFVLGADPVPRGTRGSSQLQAKH